MKLTREEALRYHRQMWTDMRKELGDKPRAGERIQFKDKWCEEHFPDEGILNQCFLCEYVKRHYDGCYGGRECLIVWPYGDCTTHDYYYDAPISEILALLERKEKE